MSGKGMPERAPSSENFFTECEITCQSHAFERDIIFEQPHTVINVSKRVSRYATLILQLSHSCFQLPQDYQKSSSQRPHSRRICHFQNICEVSSFLSSLLYLCSRGVLVLII